MYKSTTVFLSPSLIPIQHVDFLLIFPLITMKKINKATAVSALTALSALSFSPAAFAFGGLHGADVPEEARTEMKACHDSVLENYGIEMPAEVEGEIVGRRHGRRGHFREATSDLTEEQRTAIKEEHQACKTDIAAKYNLEMPDRSEKGRGFGRHGKRGGGFFGGAMQDLSEEDRASLMEAIQALIAQYTNK